MDFATESWFWTVFTGKLKSSLSMIVFIIVRNDTNKCGVPLFCTASQCTILKKLNKVHWLQNPNNAIGRDILIFKSTSVSSDCQFVEMYRMYSEISVEM